MNLVTRKRTLPIGNTVLCLTLWCFMVVLLCGLTGCTRSVRQDAVKVTTAGSTTARQMAEYYDSLADDTITVWKLTAFRRGFLKLPTPTATPSLGAAASGSQLDGVDPLAAELRKQHAALVARARLARQLSKAYEALARLANYNASDEVLKSAGNLETALRSIPALPDPNRKIAGLPITPQDIIGDIVKELVTVQENKAILRNSRRLVPILENFAKFFDSEKELYKDIAQDRAEKDTQVTVALVKAKVVVTTGLLQRVLDAHHLRWPAQQAPFTDDRLIAGVVEMIEADNVEIGVRSQDTADSVSVSLQSLIVLHKELRAKKALSLGEMTEQSQALQKLLDAVNKASNNTLVPVLEDLNQLPSS